MYSMITKRASGVLLHVASLPGDLGIGDLGPEAYKFVDFLREAGQTYWQILPLGPTGYGDSPYNCFSAFAGNTLLISPEKLADGGLLEPATAAGGSTQTEDAKIDYGSAYNSKTEILRQAFEMFQRSSNSNVELRGEFEAFTREHAWWLDDYALYRAVKADQDQKPWFEWDQGLKMRDGAAMIAASEKLSDAIRAEKFFQFLFFRQWSELKQYAGQNDIQIIGDMPLFVARDSADVWCNQNEFKLEPDGTAKFVSGVPPDHFSKTGQLWGNPIYDWDAMREDGFSWWTARVHFALKMVDIIRVDHFRGFAAAWEVPGKAETAENGAWVDVPGKELFAELARSLGDLPFIAEDLGHITPEVIELRDEFDIPGMKVLQFGFGGDAKNHDLPHNYLSNCVAYTGTHDNDTTLGWWQTLDEKTRAHVAEYLDVTDEGDEIHWHMIRAGWASVADTAIAPMQDILGLGSEARMNLPATTSGNWQWRMTKDAPNLDVAKRLRDLTATYGRA